MITYEELAYKPDKKTVYAPKTGKVYGEGMAPVQAQAQLAADLGIQPHQIDWTKIAQPIVEPAPVVPPVPPAVPPTTPPEVPKAPEVPKVPAGEQPEAITAEYVLYQGSPHAFDRAGNYISAYHASQIPGFEPQIVAQPMPADLMGKVPVGWEGIAPGTEGFDPTQKFIRMTGKNAVYDKATGNYISAEDAKKITNFWSQVEEYIDPNTVKDETGQDVEDIANPYHTIWEDFKKELGSVNDKIATLNLDYQLDVIDIEENPFLLTGEMAQELKKRKKQYDAKINNLIGQRSNLLDEFNLAIGITEKITEFEEKLTPEEELALEIAKEEAFKERELGVYREKEITFPTSYKEFELAGGGKGTDMSYAQWVTRKEKRPEEEILSPTEAATLGVPYGTTVGQATKMGVTPARYKPTTTIIKGTTGATYASRLKEVVNDIWNAKYSREQGIDILKREFPDRKDDAIAGDIYGQVPSGFEESPAYKGEGGVSNEDLI